MNLLLEYFTSDNKNRQKEYDICLHHNLRQDFIVRVIVFICDDSELPEWANDATIVRCENRPTYNDFISYCDNNLTGEICILANGDIMFEKSLEQINKENLENKFLALSRWDYQPNNTITHFDWDFSQDCWIFLSPMNNFTGGNYTMGLPGCDNRITHEVESHGLRVLNPSKLIRTIHLHTSQHRTYKTSDTVKGDYLFVSSTQDLESEPIRSYCDLNNIQEVVNQIKIRKSLLFPQST
jgi:hypothetical protein